jgi:hypothetical protein
MANLIKGKFIGRFIFIVLLVLINQCLSINSNHTKSDNKYIIDLEQNENDIYSGNLWLGFNHQKMNLIFSTVSIMSTITSEGCKDCLDSNINGLGYNFKNSGEYKSLSESLKHKVI